MTQQETAKKLQETAVLVEVADVAEVSAQYPASLQCFLWFLFVCLCLLSFFRSRKDTKLAVSKNCLVGTGLN